MLVVNPHFRTGLVDDTFRYRADWQEFATALLENVNWDILESGAARRRRGFARAPGANDADWTKTGSWSTSYDLGMMPFTRSDGQGYIVLVERNPAAPTNITIRVYNPSGAGSFETVTGSPIAAVGSTGVTDLQYSQVGDSLFFIPASSDTTIDYVYRLYYSGGFKFEKVQAAIELTGLWSGAAAANTIEPTFLGDWALDPAATTPVEVQITGSAAAANFAVPAKEVSIAGGVGDDIYVEGSWRNITAINGSGGTPPNQITFAGAALTEHTANARMRFRYDTSIADVNAIYARALTFFEGRLCLGRSLHTRYTPRPFFEAQGGPTRLRCSRSNDPFLLIPSPYNAYEDSPIDVELSAPQLRSITWLAGGRVLYIGGANGVVVVKAGLTPQSIQTVTIDAMGTCSTPPVVEQSGIIYIDSSRNALVRLRYNDSTDGYRGDVLNGQVSEKINGVTRVVLSSGKEGGIRRLYALRSNGTLASCGLDSEGNAFGWTVYEIGPGDGTFEFVDICDLNGRLYALVKSNGLGLGDSKLLVRLATSDSDYVGDFAETTTTTGGSPPNLRVTNDELKNCVVGVVSGSVNLGVFKTDANGYILNENNEPLKYNAGPPATGLYAVSSVTVYRIFESRLRPTPALPQRNDGAGFGRNHRVNKVFLGLMNTRQVKVNSALVQDPAPLGGSVLQEKAAITGWRDVGVTGFDDDNDVVIEASGVYNATIVGLSREVV